MGIKDRCPSFYYEKVAGRQAGKSIYQLNKGTNHLVEDDFEFNLAEGKMYIKDFDFTDMPEREIEIQEQLVEFQNTDIFEQEPSVKFRMKKRHDESESGHSNRGTFKNASFQGYRVNRSEAGSKVSEMTSATKAARQQKDSQDSGSGGSGYDSQIKFSNYNGVEQIDEEQKGVGSDEDMDIDETDEQTYNSERNIRSLNYKSQNSKSASPTKLKK